VKENEVKEAKEGKKEDEDEEKGASEVQKRKISKPHASATVSIKVLCKLCECSQPMKSLQIIICMERMREYPNQPRKCSICHHTSCIVESEHCSIMCAKGKDNKMKRYQLYQKFADLL